MDEPSDNAQTGLCLGDHRRGPETGRLAFRAFEPADAEAFFRLNSHPEVMRYTGEPLCPSVAAAEAGIRAYPDWELYGFGRWAAWHRAEDRIIGFAGLKYLVDIAEVDLGYRFFPEYWDIGLATEASLACVKYGFETLGLNRIVGLVLPENQASVRVLQKAGMVSEGPMSFDGEEVELFAIGASSYRRGP